MQVIDVHADMRGIYYCPECNALNGVLGLAKHGIDYEGEKLPDNLRLSFCDACGIAMQVHYPDGASLPANPSYRWEACPECHGDYKHRNGPDNCYSCKEGGFWVEVTESRAPAETAKQES